MIVEFHLKAVAKKDKNSADKMVQLKIKVPNNRHCAESVFVQRENAYLI